MKCFNCNSENLQGSLFCEECGFKFGVKTVGKVQKPHGILQEAESEIEDILFRPKKKKHSWGKALLVGVILLIVIIFIIRISNNSSINGGNSSTIDMLTPSPNPLDISCLSLNGSKMTGNTYYVPNPTFEGSLYNGCYQAVKDVVIKVNFYKYGATRSDIPLDTQYVNLADYLASQDSKAVKGTIETAVDTSGAFSWTADIYSADAY